MVTEKIVILNDPMPQEVAIALEHGFRIVQPKDVTDSKVRVYTFSSDYSG